VDVTAAGRRWVSRLESSRGTPQRSDPRSDARSVRRAADGAGRGWEPER